MNPETLLRGYDTLANVRKKELKRTSLFFWGVRGDFPTDETLGTGYDIHLLCAMIADHVTLPAIYLPFISGRQDALKKVAILQKNCLFSIFGNLLVSELIIKG